MKVCDNCHIPSTELKEYNAELYCWECYIAKLSRNDIEEEVA